MIVEDICSKIEKLEELFTIKLKERQKTRFESWNNNMSLEITQERANANTRVYNLEKSLIEKQKAEKEKSIFKQNNILKAFQNTFNQQVEQYMKFGILPKPEKKEEPKTVESVDQVNISETLVEEEQHEFEDFLADEDEGEDEDESEEEEESGGGEGEEAEEVGTEALAVGGDEEGEGDGGPEEEAGEFDEGGEGENEGEGEEVGPPGGEGVAGEVGGPEEGEGDGDVVFDDGAVGEEEGFKGEGDGCCGGG